MLLMYLSSVYILLNDSFQIPLQAVLSNLKKYTRYRIVVQAYNRIGAGPRNQDLIVSTEEDGNICYSILLKHSSYK